jgi:hypothetical protein
VRSTSEIVTSLCDRRDQGTPLPDLLCRDCAEDLDLTGAGMSLVDSRGRRAVFAASDARALRLERLQVELGEGPSVDASRTNRPSLHPRLDESTLERWPIFAPVALEAGIQAVFALPLQVVEVRLGALGLYRSSPGPLTAEVAGAAQAYADAAVALCLHLQAQVVDGDAGVHVDLEAALEHQAEVHQASGYVSVTASVGTAEALLLLRAHSFAEDRPLVEVARDVLAGRLQILADRTGSQ